MPNWIRNLAKNCWRFLRFNWRNLVVLGIAILCIIGLLWSVYLVFTSPFNGLTVLYAFCVVACASVLAYTYKAFTGGLDFLIIDDDEM